MYGVQKKEHLFFLCCFISHLKCCKALYFNMTMPDPVPHATPHSSSPRTTAKILPWPSISQDLNPNKDTWNEWERCVRGRVHAPENVCELFQALEREWVPIPAQVIHNLIQSLPEMLGSCCFSRRTHPLLLCMSLSCKLPSDWTFSRTRRVLKLWTLAWINFKMKHNELDFKLIFRTIQFKSKPDMCLFLNSIDTLHSWNTNAVISAATHRTQVIPTPYSPPPTHSPLRIPRKHALPSKYTHTHVQTYSNPNSLHIIWQY